MAEDAGSGVVAQVGPTSEKKVAGKCPWCEYRKEKIGAEIKEAKAAFETEAKRLEDYRKQLIEAGKEPKPMTNIYRTPLKELEGEQERGKGYILLMTHKVQCTGCGKFWSPDAIGKPWTLALERGTEWEREQKLKQLQGNA